MNLLISIIIINSTLNLLIVTYWLQSPITYSNQHTNMIIAILIFFFFLSIIHSQNRSLIEYPYNQHELLIRRNRFSLHSINSTHQKVNPNTQLNSTIQCPPILHYPSYSSPKHCYSHL